MLAKTIERFSFRIIWKVLGTSGSLIISIVKVRVGGGVWCAGRAVKGLEGAMMRAKEGAPPLRPSHLAYVEKRAESARRN
jgi:hypothetical protein